MFRNLLNTDRLRRFIMVASRGARATRNRYFEAGCTQAEIRGISLLKGWLSPKQLAQYESYRYFDVIGRQSGKRYRIRYGAGMNIYEIDSRGRTLAGLCFVPSETLVAGDVMLAQKIALETDEWSALAAAKVCPHLALRPGLRPPTTSGPSFSARERYQLVHLSSAQGLSSSLSSSPLSSPLTGRYRDVETQ